MHRLALLVSASLVLAPFGKAEAITPNPSNPVHCIAAFNYGAHRLSRAPRNTEKIVWMLAQAKYEAMKVKASGVSIGEAKAEGAVLTLEYAEDGKQMESLMLACETAQANDPKFKKQLPSLLEWARKAEARHYPERP